MRVIAGKYRSRALQAPRGMQTRPTSDRLRETLFNVLQPRIEGCCFFDLYAGSGAVGIEALSRGAAEVYFAEKAKPALEAIRANLRSLAIASGVQVESGGVATLLKRIAAASLSADIVFLDPPYEDADAYAQTLRMLGQSADTLLNAGAVVIAEHARKLPLAPQYGSLQRTRELVQGDAALSFFSVGEDQGTLVEREFPNRCPE